jgi:hypothetical protein
MEVFFFVIKYGRNIYIFLNGGPTFITKVTVSIVVHICVTQSTFRL